jgi:hypothetical protein
MAQLYSRRTQCVHVCVHSLRLAMLTILTVCLRQNVQPLSGTMPKPGLLLHCVSSALQYLHGKYTTHSTCWCSAAIGQQSTRFRCAEIGAWCRYRTRGRVWVPTPCMTVVRLHALASGSACKSVVFGVLSMVWCAWPPGCLFDSSCCAFSSTHTTLGT